MRELLNAELLGIKVCFINCIHI